jgi:hypothetical protein
MSFDQKIQKVFLSCAAEGRLLRTSFCFYLNERTRQSMVTDMLKKDMLGHAECLSTEEYRICWGRNLQQEIPQACLRWVCDVVKKPLTRSSSSIF